MPNRIIRDGILASENVCSLSWAEEILYRRLMSIVDDYGRMEANTKWVRSRCYPLQVDKVSIKNLENWMEALITNNLITLYAVDGKQYLEILKFNQRDRNRASKFPPPPPQLAANGRHSPPNSALSVSVSVSEGVSEGVICDAPPVAAASPSPGRPAKKVKTKFAASKPETREECCEHCMKNLGLTENDGKSLWDHWMGNGFRNDGKPMNSWRHTASNWARRKIFFPSLQQEKNR